MVEIIRSTIFTKFPHIIHGYFTRKGGVSKGEYAALNFGYNSGDLKANIDQNYQIAANYLNLGLENIITLKQIHSNIIHEFNDEHNKQKQYYEADGLFTQQHNLALTILTADCLPIIIYASDIDLIGAIHVGWRGAYLAIINNFLDCIMAKGAKIQNIYVALMPAIAQNSYEVDLDFYQKFLQLNNKNKECFIEKGKDKFLFNLKLHALNIFHSYNITNIDDIKIDTYEHKDLAFSYRRATHEQSYKTGRNLSFIAKLK